MEGISIPQQFLSKICDLYQQSCLCDVTFAVISGGENTQHIPIQVHSVVLAAHSLLFRVLFSKNPGKTKWLISIRSENLKHWRTLVNFMYSGNLDINNENIDAVSQLSQSYGIDTATALCKLYRSKHRDITRISSVTSDLQGHVALQEVVSQKDKLIQSVQVTFIKQEVSEENVAEEFRDHDVESFYLSADQTDVRSKSHQAFVVPAHIQPAVSHTFCQNTEQKSVLSDPSVNVEHKPPGEGFHENSERSAVLRSGMNTLNTDTNIAGSVKNSHDPATKLADSCTNVQTSATDSTVTSDEEDQSGTHGTEMLSSLKTCRMEQNDIPLLMEVEEQDVHSPQSLNHLDSKMEDLPEFSSTDFGSASGCNTLTLSNINLNPSAGSQCEGFTEEEEDDFVKDNISKNTIRKTKNDVSNFRQWLGEHYAEKRELASLTVAELNKYLRSFLIEARKQDGSQYEPSTLHSFCRSIDRHLREQQYPYSIIRDREFHPVRVALKAKKRELVQKHGKGRRPNMATPIGDKEEEMLWEAGHLGDKDPHVLLHTVWFNNNFLGLRRSEHYCLRLGDIIVQTDSASGLRYIEWDGDKETKSIQNSQSENPKKQCIVKPKLWECPDNTSRCPVRLHELYLSRRPKNKSDPDSPYYLTPWTRADFRPAQDVWYRSSKLGEKSLGKLMSVVCDGVLKRGKYTGQSIRKLAFKQH